MNWIGNKPVRVAEVVVLQFDRSVSEMDLQVWDESSGAWVTLVASAARRRSCPRSMECRFEPRTCSKLRLANITGGPSFTEVEVFERPFAPAPQLSLASDANGNFIGMVADGWGSAPLAGVEVSLSGQAAAGPWQTPARSDSNGLFFAPMPLGLSGAVFVTAHRPQQGAWPASPAHFAATDFQYGLTPAQSASGGNQSGRPVAIRHRPAGGFLSRPSFDDSHWAEIKVPAHFEMEGFQVRRWTWPVTAGSSARPAAKAG